MSFFFLFNCLIVTTENHPQCSQKVFDVQLFSRSVVSLTHGTNQPITENDTGVRQYTESIQQHKQTKVIALIVNTVYKRVILLNV